jgi:hypothetical protein
VPAAGNPPVRFGGRGIANQCAFPFHTPILTGKDWTLPSGIYSAKNRRFNLELGFIHDKFKLLEGKFKNKKPL